MNIATEELLGYSRINLIWTDICRWAEDPDTIYNVYNNLLSGIPYGMGYPLIIKSKNKLQNVYLYATLSPGLDKKTALIFIELDEDLSSSLKNGHLSS